MMLFSPLAVQTIIPSELQSKTSPLRIKVGFDPTSPDLHLGHAVLLRQLKKFQDQGHHLLLIIGDFTAAIGDPTGRNSLRPPLTSEEISAASFTYQSQVFKIIDPTKTEIFYNSSWLNKLNSTDFIKLASFFTASQMLERNDFAQRFQAEQPIFLHEFFYPLMQAYDSVHLKPDLEVGGTDQLFNLLMGRTLMEKFNLSPQCIMTFPILEGLTAKEENGKIVGEKMSKSLKNYIGLTDPPNEIFQKIMLMNDGLTWRYFQLLTDKSPQEIQELKTIDIVKAKEELAGELISWLWSKKELEEVKKEREAIRKGNPLQIPLYSLTIQQPIPLAKVLQLSGLVGTVSEGMRMIKGKSVWVEGKLVENEKEKLEKGEFVVRVGSKNRKFMRLIIS